MREYMADKADLAGIIDPNNQPKLVAADIKNRARSYRISRWKLLP